MFTSGMQYTRSSFVAFLSLDPPLSSLPVIATESLHVAAESAGGQAQTYDLAGMLMDDGENSTADAMGSIYLLYVSITRLTYKIHG